MRSHVIFFQIILIIFLLHSCAENFSPDTTPPQVSFANPQQDSELQGTVTIAIEASDNDGLDTIDFIVDNSVVNTFTTRPFTFQWSTNLVVNGPHFLQCRAVDKSGNISISDSLRVFTVNVPAAIRYSGIEFNVLGQFRIVNTSPGNIIFLYGEGTPAYYSQARTDGDWEEIGSAWCIPSAEQYFLNGSDSLAFQVFTPPYSCDWRVGLPVSVAGQDSVFQVWSSIIQYEFEF